MPPAPPAQRISFYCVGVRPNSEDKFLLCWSAPQRWTDGPPHLARPEIPGLTGAVVIGCCGARDRALVVPVGDLMITSTPSDEEAQRDSEGLRRSHSWTTSCDGCGSAKPLMWEGERDGEDGKRTGERDEEDWERDGERPGEGPGEKDGEDGKRPGERDEEDGERPGEGPGERDGEEGRRPEGRSPGERDEEDGKRDGEKDGEDEELQGSREDVGSPTATVKVVLMPGGVVVTMAFPISLTIQDLKVHFSSRLRVPASVLMVSLNGSEVEEHQPLVELGVLPQGTAQLEVRSSNARQHPLRPDPPSTLYGMADLLTVRLHKEGGRYQEVVVEVERPPQEKVFLGGYRQRQTGVLFHHAAVQTQPRPRPPRLVEVHSRDTQTVLVQEQSQQCSITTSTQMTSVGFYVSCTKDRLVAPGNYTPAQVYHARRLAAVLMLQSYVRRWRAVRLVKELRRDKERRLAWLKEGQRRSREEEEEQRKAELKRRRNPQRKEDFSLLYSYLERWRQEEVQRISSTLEGAERKAALCALLEEESRHIASLGSHQQASLLRLQDAATRALLLQVAAPCRWQGRDGMLLTMATPSSVRARELQELYEVIAARDPAPTPEERLEALMKLRDTVTGYNCQLTRDLVELIDREAELRRREVKPANLEGLKKRISTLFLQFVKTPTFNPAVGRLLKVPQRSDQGSQTPHGVQPLQVCRACGGCLAPNQLTVSAGPRSAPRCGPCTVLENQGRLRRDLNPYRSLLARLRAVEERLHPQDHMTHLLEEEDMRYLVEVVWGGRSALSGAPGPQGLVMGPWEPRQAWSPWNCLLLTREENQAHLLVPDPHQAYGAALVRSVRLKHLLARNHFTQITSTLPRLQYALGNQLVTRPIPMETGTAEPC
ncbi:IQ and ubiquitin-like domain-containing protein [Gadus chalcogrammus]|uniref:IQ and ubiquitin-like domain-containing protein n=1 Tax=Gadus chalcogrammus TaxID=1042646 RepID=UPI0024C48AA5|nr:IQ and ubiquitin-like domain-containing protein [Gadus chalcogrammus]